MAVTAENHRRQVAVPPGQYWLELLLSEYKSVVTTKINNFSDLKEVRRQRIKTPATELVNVRAGSNQIVFTLPPTISPKKLTYTAQYPAGVEKAKPIFSPHCDRKIPRDFLKVSLAGITTPQRMG